MSTYTCHHYLRHHELGPTHLGGGGVVPNKHDRSLQMATGVAQL